MPFSYTYMCGHFHPLHYPLLLTCPPLVPFSSQIACLPLSCLFICIFLLIFLAILRFKLRVLRILGRHSYCLSHCSHPPHVDF